ncbi:glycosyltransferase family 4 protein [Staphylococcus sp. EZ-P03]|uniref:glycosyltransferase family 4 protein n=1 Tax=Staphylococcus sp. EZ-P03 TaxID=2282739 RepID=UPI000DF83236|nr:glycosyltransferase family 4 protein [Staphylococcus sp. EZ-P03]
MKIAQVTAIDMTMNNFLTPLNKGSKDAGYEVHCICSKGPYEQEIKNNGFAFHDIKIDRKIDPISNLKSIMMMVKAFKVIKPDIVHVHTPVAAVLGRIAAKIAKVPTIIYSAHGFYFHEGMSKNKYRLFFNIEKYIGRYFTDYIFTQSLEDYEVAKNNQFLKNKSNYVHISNGIDLDEKFNVDNFSDEQDTKLREQYGIKKDDLVVSFIGRLVKEKGIIDLLEAYNNLNIKNVKFVIIGSLPQGERDIETYELIQKYESNENIIFTGQITNVNEHLFMSDIFCLPSYREGMPRSIIEAMAMKNAVLATNIRGSREEVIHGETGYLFPVNSSKSIATYISELANDKALLDEMKNNGLERAKALYDENKVVNKQLDIFKQCTKR